MPEPQPALDMPVPFGVVAQTGQLLEGLDESTLSSFKEKGPDTSAEQAWLTRKVQQSEPTWGVVNWVNPNKLERAGWAVMFSPGVDRKMKEALQPLLNHRKIQVGDEKLFKIFEGPTGYHVGDTASKWLARHGLGMNVVNPAHGVPYYLLIVGPPDEIPFEFQYHLDINWAVGRVWFQTADEFRQYAESVIKYETMRVVPTSRQMTIWAPKHDFDRATQSFCNQVATPLVTGGDSTPVIGLEQKFVLQPLVGKSATKEGLDNVFTGSSPNGPSALLFSGSHGLVVEAKEKEDESLQEEMQGALVCQGWTGGSTGKDDWYAGSDLPAKAKIHGLVHFLFACFGAGWPEFDNFTRQEKPPKQIASRPMLARLPQALLAHPNGGALAVIGHIDRAWVYSFQSDPQSRRRTSQIEGFCDVLDRVLSGDRLGQATDQFNLRWAALSTELVEVLDGRILPSERLASQWVARDDARNYIIFGDPAVRLRVEDMPECQEAK